MTLTSTQGLRIELEPMSKKRDRSTQIANARKLVLE